MGEPWAVFLDRDGTLNEHVPRDGRRSSPRRVEELIFAADAAPALARLAGAGATLVIVTNQPDVARGLLPAARLAELHERFRIRLGVAAVYVCPHTAGERCRCRKPADGLLRRAAADHGVAPAASYLIGDRATDAQPAIGLGVTAVLLGAALSICPYLWYAPDLTTAAGLVLTDRRRRSARPGPGRSGSAAGQRRAVPR